MASAPASQLPEIYKAADANGIPRPVFLNLLGYFDKIPTGNDLSEVAKTFGDNGKSNNGNWGQAIIDFTNSSTPTEAPEIGKNPIQSGVSFSDMFNSLWPEQVEKNIDKAREANGLNAGGTGYTNNSVYSWIKSYAVDIVFVLGGMALIVASIYTALHGQSLPALVTNAGRKAASL